MGNDELINASLRIAEERSALLDRIQAAMLKYRVSEALALMSRYCGIEKQWLEIVEKQKRELSRRYRHAGSQAKSRKSPLSLTGKVGSEIPPKKGINLREEE